MKYESWLSPVHVPCRSHSCLFRGCRKRILGLSILALPTHAPSRFLDQRSPTKRGQGHPREHDALGFLDTTHHHPHAHTLASTGPPSRSPSPKERGAFCGVDGCIERHLVVLERPLEGAQLTDVELWPRAVELHRAVALHLFEGAGSRVEG